MHVSNLMVLDTCLLDAEADEFTDRPRINCSRKKAYGCGEHGQVLVEGLSLHVRRLDSIPHLTCCLSISLGQEAIRSVRAELDAPIGQMIVQGSVQNVSEQLLVLLVVFRIHEEGKLTRYLVYDTTDASLYMIPNLPDGLLARKNTGVPVPRRTADGRGSQLFLMARNFGLEPVKREFLCSCTLPTGVNPASDSSIVWQIKDRCFPNLGSFSADVIFTFQDKVFWADLSQGLAFWDPDRDSVVEFDFIKLPEGYAKISCVIGSVDQHEDGVLEPATMRRNIVCVGGSIKFICIDRPHEKLKLWSLDLGRRKWKQEKSVYWKELRKQITCPEVRDLEPCFPNLLPDGTLCLVLYNRRQIRRSAYPYDYLCSFDMSSKKLRLSRRFLHFPFYDRGPVVLPSEFLAKCCSPSPRKRSTFGCESKLRTNKRKVER